MNVRKNLDSGDLAISSILAGFFWRRLIKNKKIGDRTAGWEGLSLYKYRGSHTNFTTNYLHNIYCYYTMLLHVLAIHFGRSGVPTGTTVM